MTTNFKPSLYGALDKIGKTNGHNVPQSQDPITGALHEYHVSTLAESYFKKRREVAKDTMLKEFSTQQKAKVVATIADTKKNMRGSVVTLVESEHYNLQLKPRVGAEKLDVTMLRNKLMTVHKMKLETVDALFAECTGRNEPALTYEVTEK